MAWPRRTLQDTVGRAADIRAWRAFGKPGQEHDQIDICKDPWVPLRAGTAGRTPVPKCAGRLVCGREPGSYGEVKGWVLCRSRRRRLGETWAAGRPCDSALGLALALAWSAAAGEPCTGTSQGCPPATPEAGALGRLSALRSEAGGRVAEASLGRKPAQRTESPSALTRLLSVCPTTP